MYHMLTAFNLAAGTDPQAFCDRYDAFVAHMVELGLALGSDPVARRDPASPLDTATGLPQRYFALMHFADRAQADRAYDRIKRRWAPSAGIHAGVFTLADDMLFLAWDDLVGTPVTPRDGP